MHQISARGQADQAKATFDSSRYQRLNLMSIDCGRCWFERPENSSRHRPDEGQKRARHTKDLPAQQQVPPVFLHVRLVAVRVRPHLVSSSHGSNGTMSRCFMWKRRETSKRRVLDCSSRAGLPVGRGVARQRICRFVTPFPDLSDLPPHCVLRCALFWRKRRYAAFLTPSPELTVFQFRSYE